MLIEGIMLYLLIIEVYNNELKLRLCYSFSFGKSLEETQVKAEKTLAKLCKILNQRWCLYDTGKHLP